MAKGRGATRHAWWGVTAMAVIGALLSGPHAAAQTPAPVGSAAAPRAPVGSDAAVPVVPAGSATVAPSGSAAVPEAPTLAPPNLTPSRTLPVAGKPIPVPLPRTGAGKPLHWHPEWSRFDHWDAVLSAIAGASMLTTAIVRPIAPFRQGGVLFDEGARNALRAPSYSSRGTARDVSDVLLSLSLTAPFLVDSLSVAFWYRGSADVAAEMALIDAETFLVTGAVQGLFTTFTARERPYGRTCGGKGPDDTPGDTIDCASNDRYRSFFSGHSAFPFASASLTCSHHITLHLFDSPTADIGACVTMYTAAAATATLRVVGDKHYASDVIVGSIVGAAMGWAVPYFLHYREPKKTSLTRPSESSFRWHIMPTANGGSIVGVF